MKNLIIFSLSSLLFSSCFRKDCQIPGGYEFEIPAVLTPARDTFYIGDTITFNSSFSDEVYERKTDLQYKLENFKFYPRMRIVELSDSVLNKGAVLNFEILVENDFIFSQFNYDDGSISYLGEYNYKNNEYLLKYKLIPKYSGLYLFNHYSAIYVHNPDQDFTGKCNNNNIDAAAVKLNNGADNNVSMLSVSPDPHYSDWMLNDPDARFHKFGGYCFYVKE